MKLSLSFLSNKKISQLFKGKNTRDPNVLSFHRERDWVLLVMFLFLSLVFSFLVHGYLYVQYLKNPPVPTAQDADVDLKKDRTLYDKAESWVKMRDVRYKEAETMSVPPDPSL